MPASALLTAQAKPLFFCGKGEEKYTIDEAEERNGGKGRRVAAREGCRDAKIESRKVI